MPKLHLIDGRVIEAVDHRDAVREQIAQRHGLQRPVVGIAVERVLGLLAVLGDERVDDAVLDHHGVVEHRHVGHAAIGMARVDVAAEEGELLGGRLRRHAARFETLRLVHDAAHASGR